MAVEIRLDALKPWEAFTYKGEIYDVVIVPISISTTTVSCIKRATYETVRLPRKTKVRRV